LEVLGLDGYAILKWVLNMMGKYGLVNWLMSGINVGLLFVGN
jgi:hypothetical protein